LLKGRKRRGGETLDAAALGGWGGNTWHRQAFGGEKVERKCEKGMSRERKKIRKNAHLLNKNKQKLKHGYNLTLLHGVTEYAQYGINYPFICKFILIQIFFDYGEGGRRIYFASWIATVHQFPCTKWFHSQCCGSGMFISDPGS
jgi:hypothetical protein